MQVSIVRSFAILLALSAVACGDDDDSPDRTSLNPGTGGGGGGGGGGTGGGTNVEIADAFDCSNQAVGSCDSAACSIDMLRPGLETACSLPTAPAEACAVIPTCFSNFTTFYSAVCPSGTQLSEATAEALTNCTDQLEACTAPVTGGG